MSSPSGCAQLYPLPGQVALVTGAGSGIGAACAIRLAQAGATVVCADVNGSAGSVTVERIEAAGGEACAVRLDVADRDAVTERVDALVAALGRLNVLVNAAGVLSTAPVLDASEDDFDTAWRVNFKGTLFLCQAAGRHMSRAGGGSIVNLVSTAIDQPAAGFAAYAASKSAVAMLTRTLALELGAQGVRVNAIAPGQVDNTGMQERHYRGTDGEIDPELRAAARERMLSIYPLKIVAEPTDIADSALFLASAASRVITGQVLRPNSGLAMR